jgi:tetratricopeptide (TPR) repeat protein
MKLSIPLKDIMIAPGKRFDPAEHSEQDVTTRIKKLYGMIAQVMNIVIDNGMAHIEFRDATPEKFAEAMKKLAKGVDEAGKGRLPEALKLFQAVLTVIPENVAARRNVAKVYLEQGKLEKAKQHLQECLQIDPTDAYSYVMLGNIYLHHENNLVVAAFYYEKCLELYPDDAMVLTNYAGLMTQKQEFQKAEILFKKAIKIHNVPNAYYGLALLYRMAGELEESKSVLETMFVRIPQQTLARDHAGIYAEANALYSELSKEKKH